MCQLVMSCGRTEGWRNLDPAEYAPAFESVRRFAALTAMRAAGRWQDADRDDAVQDALLTLWKAMPVALALPGESRPPLAWVKLRSRRAAVRSVRRRGRAKDTGGASGSVLDTVPDPRAADADWKLEARLAAEALNRLPEKDRDVIRLKFGLDGPPLTYAEVGERMGFSHARAQAICDRGLTRLRDVLGAG